MQKLAKFSLKTAYLLGLKNLVADLLSKQPDEACFPDDVDIGEYASGPYTL